MQLALRSNVRQVRRAFQTTEQREMPKIMAQALTQTARNVRTQTARTIAKESGLKVGAVRNALAVTKATWQRARSRVTAAGRAINLAAFGARETRRGISARAYGKRRIYRGAFFAYDRSGVYIRRTAARYPLRPLFGPSVPSVWRQAENQETLAQTIQRRWPINFGQAFRRRLGRTP